MPRLGGDLPNPPLFHGKGPPVNVVEFLAFTDRRPDGERWELISGEPVETTGLSDIHQMIVTNLASALLEIKRRDTQVWCPILGMLTRTPVKPCDLPWPDVLILSRNPTDPGVQIVENPLAIFDVISPTDPASELVWRLQTATSIPNCQHYVTVSQSKATATRYDRASDWRGSTVAGLQSVLQLPALGAGVNIPFTEMYRWTPLGEPD